MKKMGLKKFLSMLPKKGWKEDNSGALRYRVGSKKSCCPITAVALRTTGKHYSTYDYVDAAVAINLNEDLIDPIVIAADGANDRTTAAFRKKLVAACGLKRDRLMERTKAAEKAYKEGR